MQEVNQNPERWITRALDERRAAHLERRITAYDGMGGTFTANGRTVLNFGSNDYLDLARHPRLKEAARRALDDFGTGSTASRLVTGTLPLHEELERVIAGHKGYPAALVFGSGYMTNAGVISSVLDRKGHAFADRLVHASMVDAVRLSGARLHRFHHNDVDSLARQLERHASGRCMILTESVFSMDGDLAPLSDIATLAEQYDALLMVDEAHAGGVFGPEGAGLIVEYGLQEKVAVSMGTLSKAMGGYGGYVACSASMRQWLINYARSLIYTTALPPPVIAAAIEAFRILHDEPALGATVLARAQRFRAQLQEAGLDTMQSESPIVPVLIGDNERALRIARRLADKDIVVGALRPPTVPHGTARLRLSVTLAHTEDNLDRVAAEVADAFHKESPS